MRSSFMALLGMFILFSQTQASGIISVPSAHQVHPFSYGPGERLVYDVRYMGIPAGEAIMEVLDPKELKGRQAYHVVSTVESNEFVSLFYPVNNRIETFIDTEGFYSHYVRIKQRQGKRRKEKEIDFDQVRHRAVQVKRYKGEQKEEIFDIPPHVQDSLSALYYFRMHRNLQVGQSVFINVHESRKNWKLEIQILGKEIISTPLGTFNTIKTKALVRYEGVFMDKGDVTIWFTDDEKHIPVLIKTKIKVGHIHASLKVKREPNKTFAKRNENS